MIPRTVPVNWDDLEMALSTNPGEGIYYLDTWNGEVQMLPGGRLGEDDDWPSEEEIDDCAEWLAAVFELDAGAYRQIVRGWAAVHARRKNLWLAIRKRRLPL